DVVLAHGIGNNVIEISVPIGFLDFDAARVLVSGSTDQRNGARSARTIDVLDHRHVRCALALRPKQNDGGEVFVEALCPFGAFLQRKVNICSQFGGRPDGFGNRAGNAAAEDRQRQPGEKSKRSIFHSVSAVEDRAALP
ncbi:MAG: hypothetical protein WBH52_01935, partial [Pseudomonas aeruginosa]